MQNNTHYRQEDKIDLRELFSIFQKRKKLIWSVTISITLFSLIYVLLTKPVYEIKSMIQVGEVDKKPIDNINDIKQKLSYEYHINTKDKKLELPRVTDISIPKNSASIFSLTVHANNNQEGIKYIQTVIKKIETEYKEKTDVYIANQKELIKLIRIDIKENTQTLLDMKEDLDKYSQKIISLKGKDAALAGIYALQVSQKNTEIQELKKYISDLRIKEQELKLSITPLKMKPTRIVGQPETLDKPIKPRKALIVIIAFITGLMFSIFFSFFVEFLKTVKEEEPTEN